MKQLKQNNVGESNARPMIKTKKGITLVALVITIIVLLILAGITISLTIGEDGIITKAQEAKTKQEKGKEEENRSLEQTSETITHNIREIENGKLQSIEIKAPTKTEYIVGEDLDTTGMLVNAVYANGNKIDITNEVQVSGYNKRIEGTHLVTVKYAEKTATFEVTSKAIYTIKVDGIEYRKAFYNTVMEITAEEEKDGKKFSGWKIGDVVVSTNLTYQWAVTGDIDLTKVYGETLQLTPKVLITNLFMIARTKDDKTNARTTVRIVKPTEYTLVETGIFWTGRNKDNVPNLYDENGEAKENAKKVIVASVNRNYEFAFTLNGIPRGKTMRVVAFAKFQKGDEVMWVFSEEQSVTNIGD